MEFFLPEDDLQRVPPEETKILSLAAEPYEDARRVKVRIDISPFEVRPHLEVLLKDSREVELSRASFVEPMGWRLEFTLHIRGEPAEGPLTLQAYLYYPDGGPQAEPASMQFELPPS